MPTTGFDVMCGVASTVATSATGLNFHGGSSSSSGARVRTMPFHAPLASQNVSLAPSAVPRGNSAPFLPSYEAAPAAPSFPRYEAAPAAPAAPTPPRVDTTSAVELILRNPNLAIRSHPLFPLLQDINVILQVSFAAKR